MNWANLAAAGGLGLLVGLLVYLVGTWMDRRRARQAEAMERTVTAAEQAAEGFNRLADSARRIRFPRQEDRRG